MTTTPLAPSKTPATDSGSGRLLAAVLAALFMALLDVFIVNVAAPTIGSDLGASGAQLQLVVAGYAITYSVLLITGARLGDRFGHGRVHLAGLALFTGASLACGLAQGAAGLIGFRLVQGAGSAVMIPQVLSLIQRAFTGEARVRALGVYSAVLAVGAAAGQIVGGVLVSADLFGTGWRPVFLVNVPVGVFLLVVGRRVLPRAGGAGSARRLDWPGQLLLGAAVSLVTVPLVLGQEAGWPLWSWLSLLAGAAVLALFRAHESRLARHGGVPLIAPRVLRHPGTALAVVRIAAVMAVNGAFLFVLTLHLQAGLGYSALRAGLTFGPTAVVFGAVGLTWRRWPARLQRALVPGGFALVAAAVTGVGLALRDGSHGGAAVYVAYAGLGAGLAMAFGPTLTRALAAVRAEDAADASGLLATVTQVGQLVGVSAFGTLFLNRLESLEGPRAYTSSEALLVCMYALAATAVAGAVSGLVLRRR
ncbi:MFS transporter [Streptomyces niveiscabiei]|uniref:MFS transporter n=1 Tax=Streptomyces niveiscabiei TaxID=164115 RepID=UPI0029BAAE19|nr:MFS transporter [Streptomyces niveiscabiei]MDX3385580.1 MFS transporter [Streptomyces niveiscabiei]